MKRQKNYYWKNFRQDCELLAKQIEESGTKYTSIYGIPQGGVAPAVALSARLSIPILPYTVCGALVVDDITDTGRTANKYRNFDLAVLHKRPTSNAVNIKYYANLESDYVLYPWESEEKKNGEDIVVRFLEYFGINPNEENFIDTPKRMINVYKEMLEGMTDSSREELAGHLSKTFSSDYTGLVVVRDIECWGLCPHHFLPVQYIINLGYLPNKRVLGASKLPRLVSLLSKRPILQEQLTKDIIDCLDSIVTLGSIVHVVGRHLCMEMRGIKSSNSKMVTTSISGVFENDKSIKQEFYSMIGV